MEKVKEFDAHSDFIRCLIVHPKEAWLISCSDDQTIALWDVEKGFTHIRSYEEHKNFVMRIAINPKDVNMFASAGMDNKVKIWSFTAANSNLTLEGHTKGVSAVCFCPLNDKPYLASGSDDKTIRIWDYNDRHCIYVFDGHEDNISAVSFHPELPLLISGSEDHSCKFWNINTFKLEESKVFGYDTVWDIAVQASNNMVALGCEEATVVLRMGNDQPLATFNASQAKIIYAKQNVINSVNLKVIGDVKDGEIIDIPPKNLGTTELYPMVNYFNTGS
jgi:coatomer subunit beta'